MAVVLNGNEQSNYIITKPHGQYSAHFSFQNPFNINAADVINFRSKTTNGSVTHSVVSLVIELDI